LPEGWARVIFAADLAILEYLGLRWLGTAT
jgi:hypothetical protein